MGGGLSFPKDPIPNDRVVIVTGGNNGIGYETAKWIAMLGARVIIACRSEERATQAIENMQKDFIEEQRRSRNQLAEKLDVSFMKLDLSSLKSTEEFIQAFKSTGSKLHTLILNAGMGGIPLTYTEDNFEWMFQVNYLSHFLLAMKLIPIMKTSGEDCRIVLVSSIAHNWGEFNLETAQARHLTKNSFSHLTYYGNSKLYQIMHMYSLNKRLVNSNICVSSLHPGAVNSGFKANFTELGCCSACFTNFMYCCCCCFCLTPHDGAMTQINAAINPKFQGVRDAYFKACSIVTPSAAARNTTYHEQLWTYSLECLQDHLAEEDIHAVEAS